MKKLNLELVKEFNENVINHLINDFENGMYSDFTEDKNFPQFLETSLLDEMFLFEKICNYSMVDELNYEDYINEFPVDEIQLEVSNFISIFYERF